MKLRTQFLLSSFVLAVLLLLTVILAVGTWVRVQGLREQQERAASIERRANDLSYLSNNYLLYREQVRLQQWNSTVALFTAELGRLKVRSVDEVMLVSAIRTGSERLESVFREVVTTTAAAPDNSARQYDPEFLQVSWARMEVQNRQIIGDVAHLQRLLTEQVDRGIRTTALLLFSLTVAFGGSLLGGYLLMYRRTIAGLAALQRGTEVIGGGDLDFRISETRRDEIGELSRAFNRMTTDLKGVTASKKDLQKEVAERQRAEEEIDALFRRLQETLLDIPEKMPGVRFGHIFRSATEGVQVGGDFYDVFQARDGLVGLLIGDVSGHGMEAARLGSLVKDTVHAFAHQFRRPHLVLRETNRLLVEMNRDGFVTAFIGFLDPGTGSLMYSSAGHPPPLIVTDREVTSLGSGSAPLGVFLDARYCDCEVDMRPGQTIIFYTDGITEARRGDTFYGEEGLVAAVQALIARPTEDLPSLLLERALVFSGGHLHDDVAVLAVNYVGKPDTGETAF